MNTSGQWPLRDTVELQLRDGLPNYFQKIKNGAATKVGFIGGSVTSADGWRPMAMNWMKEHYKNPNVIEHNAAIGGTNSKYGVFRMDRELLAKDDFDLIFIEFSLNDNPGTKPDVEKSIEGMVRKIWQKNPYTDICLVYTIRDITMIDISNGKMSLTASKHDSIASYYNIPSILWGVEWHKLITSGTAVIYDEIVNKETSQNASGQYVFTSDKVHPTQYGHRVYADVLAKCFKSMEDVSGTYAHVLKDPLLTDNYVDAKMLPPSSMFNHGMSLIESTGQIPYLDPFLENGTKFLVSENSEEYYSFTFNGTIVGLNLIIGPSVGRYYIEVDGNMREYSAFNGYSGIWRRHSLFVNLPDGDHLVKIYPSSNKLSVADKEEILISDKYKEDIWTNPDKYATNELIFSDIFILGEMINPLSEKKKICTGDSLFWEGNYYSEPGLYYSTYQSVDGSDSILELDLEVVPLPEFSLGPSTIMNYDDTLTISVDGDFTSYLWHDNDTLNEKQFIAAEMDEGTHLVVLSVTNANQCQNTDTIEITVQKDSSLAGAENALQFQVYPNPTTSVLHITSMNLLKEETEISLFTLSGKKILHKTCHDNRINVSLDITNQPSGIYLLRVQSGNSETVVKIVKG